ncbi:hypothetical protein HPB52_002280 [Rhipicephalus sanguineus]|uniref:Uncharacterized protein n=1 Tax=Rhipicephalus sanguineus TaxID=34632 RepID=A0A9D4PV37_RHISA|nr:hypothetical protein HPB52_002280 [Rhipicephalus sanguineus]
MRPPTPNAASPLLALHGHRLLQNVAHYHGYRRNTTKLSCDSLNLADLGPACLTEAVCAAAAFDSAAVLHIDHVRIHPTNNTITISAPDENRAMAHLKITQLKVADWSCTMAVYARAPDNSVRGIIFNAHSFESDNHIFNELRARNPAIDIVGAR